jgi:hypothetical protein
MKIYKQVQRFDPVTGKPIMRKSYAETRCDFTGQVLDGGDDQYCSYPLNYEDYDPCFGADGEEYDFGQKHGIEMFEFLSGEYHFASVGGGDGVEHYAEAQMMEEALKGATKKKSEWYRCFTFDSMCRHARIRTAQRLIDAGEIKPEDLIGD